LLGEEEVSKIEEMLREKWHAEEVVVSSYKDGWKISFLIDDYKKIFVFFDIIKQYRGEIVDRPRYGKVDVPRARSCD